MNFNKLPLIPYYAIKVPANFSGRTLKGAKVRQVKDFRTQFTLLTWYAERTGRELLAPDFDLLRSRSTKFIHQPGFRRALERAEQENAVVLLSDFYALLTRSDCTSRAFMTFLKSGAHITRIESVRDAGNPFAINPVNKNIGVVGVEGTKISSAEAIIHPEMRFQAAQLMQKSRGLMIQDPVNRNGNPDPRQAARANRVRADRFAEVIKPHIEELLAEKTPPTTLKALAASLNDKGVTTRRGARWTPAATKRVLDRLNITLST